MYPNSSNGMYIILCSILDAWWGVKQLTYGYHGDSQTNPYNEDDVIILSRTRGGSRRGDREGHFRLCCHGRG